MNNTLLISTETIKQSLPIKNLDDNYIVPSILLVQDIKLQEWIGSSLCDRLKEDVANETLTNDYKLLLDLYIEPYLMWETMVQVVPTVIFKVRNAGVVTNHNEHISAMSFKDADAILSVYEKNANFYGDRLYKFLRLNSSKYPEFCQSCGCGNTKAHKSFHNPIYV